MTTKTETPEHVLYPSKTIALVDITPSMATLWLGCNHNYRRLDNAQVARYAADMATGNWTSNGGTIQFDRYGRLIDGQHRLEACQRSGVTMQQTIVVRGVESDRDIDTGRNRTVVTRMAYEKVPHAQAVAANARILAVYDAAPDGMNALANMARRPTPAQIYDTCGRYPDLKAAVASCPRHSVTGYPVQQWYPALHCLFYRRDPDLADSFRAELMDGAGAPASNGFVLSRTLSGLDRRLPVKERIDRAVRTWNASREGRILTRVVASRSGIIPEIA